LRVSAICFPKFAEAGPRIIFIFYRRVYNAA
jgi:hypothetical protein